MLWGSKLAPPQIPRERRNSLSKIFCELGAAVDGSFRDFSRLIGTEEASDAQGRAYIEGVSAALHAAQEALQAS